MKDLGIVKPGTTIYVPFATYDSNDPSASVTITGLATTDIEIYKDGSTTQRASDAGYTLLDTDGIDFDTVTGIHGVSIDLSDNTTAGFYEAGSQYWVVIASITVDAATINFIPVTFTIGYPDAIINTSIATLSSQTSFTLSDGPAENDALNGCVVCIHDVASAVQLGFGVITDYVGSTRTVTLAAGVSFTAAATDNIAIFPPANAAYLGGTAQTGRDIGSSVLLSNGTGTGQVSLSSGVVSANAVQISGDSGAADNLELDYDGTGYNKSNSTIGTCTTNTDMRGTDSAFLAASAPTNFSALGISVGGAISNVTTVATTTTNTDMRGTDNALLASSAPTNFSDMSISATTGLVDITQAAADKAWSTGTRVLTANTNLNDPTAAAVATAVLTTQMTESYAANGVAPTLAQGVFAMHQKLMQTAYSGTASISYQLDNTTIAFQGTLDDATNPTSDRRV